MQRSEQFRQVYLPADAQKPRSVAGITGNDCLECKIQSTTGSRQSYYRWRAYRPATTYCQRSRRLDQGDHQQQLVSFGHDLKQTGRRRRIRSVSKWIRAAACSSAGAERQPVVTSVRYDGGAPPTASGPMVSALTRLSILQFKRLMIASAGDGAQKARSGQYRPAPATSVRRRRPAQT